MSEAELDGLERDVDEARRRVAYDLNRLRSPGAIERFKDEALDDLRQRKDRIVERGIASGKETIQALVDDVKRRAIANPGAALSIGAGLAWHLLRRPPITSALVGLGLVGLFRTPPAGAGETLQDNLLQQAGAAARSVEKVGAQLGGRVSEIMQAGIDRAYEAGNAILPASAERAGTAPSRAARAGERVALGQAGEARDQVLVGAAALSVTAAIAIALTRRLAG